MTVKNDRLQQAYNLQSKDDVLDLYRDWAETYEQDMTEQLSYVGPKINVEILCDHVTDPDANIIDIGCGTGLAGIQLAERGFRTFDGLDLSAEMLSVARRKNVYRALYEGDLTKTLPLADNLYDAAISIGTFTEGHVRPDGLKEVLRIIRPGGIACISINERIYLSHGYERAFADFKAQQLCKIVEIRDTEYVPAENIGAKTAVLEVLS